MSVGIDQFQPLSFAQANPQFAASDAINKIINNEIQAQYAQPMAQQALLKQQYSNQIAQANAKYANPMALAKLQLAQSQPGLTQAQTSEAGSQAGLNYANANLIQGKTPYLIQQAKLGAYTNPLVQFQAEIANAKQTNPELYKLLTQYNFTQPQNGSPSGQQVSGGMGNPQSVGVNGLNANPSTAPNFMPQTNDTAQNFAYFQSPYNPFMKAQLTAQSKAQGTGFVDQYNKAQADAQSGAQVANNLENLSNQFIKNYDKSKLVGNIKGVLPVTGIKSLLSEGVKYASGGSSDLTAEQLADNASQNLAAAVAKLVAGGRVTNYEMQYVQNLKPGRYMTPQAANTAANFLRAKSIRMQEEPAFLNAARARGISSQVAQGLWNQYNIDRPVYNFDKDKVNSKYQNSWKDYITNNAVNSQQQGSSFSPQGGVIPRSQSSINVPHGTVSPSSFSGMVRITTPDGRRLRIPANNLKKALAMGAKQI